MGGSSSAIYGDMEPGTYGALGTPSPDNIPGGRDGAASWTDSSGNLWLFGGLGYDAIGTMGYLNDLWEFNPSTNEWTWINGSSATPPSNGGLSGQPGVYGTLGTPSPENVPGGRYDAASWTDSSGNLWLFGGTASDQRCVGCLFNDLWKFNTSTSQWAWMGGSSPATCTTNGVACVWRGYYGTLGVPAAGNVPGSHAWSASWTDASGHFWLFGGYGDGASGNSGALNDLWEFNPSTNEWAWMGGSSTTVNDGGQPGVYGTLRTPAAGNIPGSRDFASSWTDGSGNLWLFGGDGYDANGDSGYLNDLWKFNPSTNEWAWMGGSSTKTTGYGQPGVYGTLGTPAPGNTPGSHWESASWTDSSGNLWLFGGWGYDANGNDYLLNDLCEFSPSTSEWMWMGGNSDLIIETSLTNTGVLGWPGVYGTLGTPAPGNMPGGRYSAASWTDKAGNFWLFGGSGVLANGPTGEVNDFNDLWRYQPSTTYSFPTVATPTFSVAGGTFTTVQTVTISDTTPDATIFYTTDGTAPTFSSAIYTSPLTVSTVSTSETVEAMAVAANYFNTAVASGTYNIDLPVNWYTLTTIASSLNPSNVGEYVTFTATVTPVSNSATPAGTVQFSAGDGAPMGSPVALNGSGVATYTTAALFAGEAFVTAAYIPSSASSFAPSTSSPLQQYVAGPCSGMSATTLTSSQNPSNTGQSVTFTATVAFVVSPALVLCDFGGGPPPNSGTYAPSGIYGTVQFTVNGTAIGSQIPVSGSGTSGVATYSTTKLPAGTDAITAVFTEGNGYVGSSESSPLSQVVTGTATTPDFSVEATPASLTLTAGQSGTTAVSVTPLNGFDSAVSFGCSGLPSGASCNFSPATVTPSGEAASTTLTVTTSATTTAALHRNSRPLFPAAAVALVLCCLGWKKRRRLQMMLLMAVSVFCLSLLTSCSAATTGPPVISNPVTSTITVTATAVSIQHTTSFSLTVN
jgi:N-acetylneuraminic acid mutarotase